MKLSLSKVISNSGDSELLAYSFIDGTLEVELYLDELDETVRFFINTNNLMAAPLLDNTQSNRTCFIKLLSLEEHALMINNHYIAPSDFASLMQHRKQCITLAYGMRVEQVKYIFQIRGADVFIACTIKSQSDISFSFLD